MVKSKIYTIADIIGNIDLCSECPVLKWPFQPFLGSTGITSSNTIDQILISAIWRCHLVMAVSLAYNKVDTHFLSFLGFFSRDASSCSRSNVHDQLWLHPLLRHVAGRKTSHRLLRVEKKEKSRRIAGRLCQGKKGAVDTQ